MASVTDARDHCLQFKGRKEIQLNDLYDQVCFKVVSMESSITTSTPHAEYHSFNSLITTRYPLFFLFCYQQLIVAFVYPTSFLSITKVMHRLVIEVLFTVCSLSVNCSDLHCSSHQVSRCRRKREF